MSITNKITEHYQKSINGELKKYHCEEWATDIYFKTTYPFRDESKIVELAQKGQIVDALVETVIIKARDAEGKRLFQDADRAKLMNEADPAVIIKVATAINNGKVSLTQEQTTKE